MDQRPILRSLKLVPKVPGRHLVQPLHHASAKEIEDTYNFHIEVEYPDKTTRLYQARTFKDFKKVARSGQVPVGLEEIPRQERGLSMRHAVTFFCVALVGIIVGIMCYLFFPPENN